MKIGVITACWVYKLSGYDASTPWGEAQGRFEEQWSPEALDGLLGEIKELGDDGVRALERRSARHGARIAGAA